eukprot:3049654-Heterocapsa_arctica.AAC.1
MKHRLPRFDGEGTAQAHCQASGRIAPQRSRDSPKPRRQSPHPAPQAALRHHDSRGAPRKTATMRPPRWPQGLLELQ